MLPEDRNDRAESKDPLFSCKRRSSCDGRMGGATELSVVNASRCEVAGDLILSGLELENVLVSLWPEGKSDRELWIEPDLARLGSSDGTLESSLVVGRE